MGTPWIDGSQAGQATSEYAITLGVILFAVAALFTALSGVLGTTLQSVAAGL